MQKRNIHKCEKRYNPQMIQLAEPFEMPPLITRICFQINYYILKIIYILRQIISPTDTEEEEEEMRKGYLSLYDRYEKSIIFCAKYFNERMVDCWNHVICSVPTNELMVKEAKVRGNATKIRYTGSITKCLNLASYNYIGFGQSSGPCAEAAITSLYTSGVSTGGTRQQYGTCQLHDKLEELMAQFLGVEDVITFAMGYGTNSLNIPALLSPGCLVISDQKNHPSMIVGVKLSGAFIKICKHNDMEHLEKLLKEAIYYGQPNQPNGKFKAYKKVIILVEGIYSMEGTFARLPEIIFLKKKYKAYLYVDEAHSIGTIGKHGKGITEYFHCDPKEVDLLMGVFSKSFAAAGGYIAGSKKLVTFLRDQGYASKYGIAIAPGVAAQIISVLKILIGKNRSNIGQKRFETLARNSVYFRRKCKQMGLIIHGDDYSPVVPILVYFQSKMCFMIRAFRKEGIAIIGIMYPITPLNESKIRICISSTLSKEQLDRTLEVLNRVAEEIGIKYSRKISDRTPIVYDKLEIY